MINCFFVSDLHGHIDRFEKLFRQIKSEKPDVLFIGGDVLPGGHYYRNRAGIEYDDFLNYYLFPHLRNLQKDMGENYPTIFVIMGNDDARIEETKFIRADEEGLWHYINEKKVTFKEYNIFGYSYVPPTPFMLKDWERYDVSRFVDVGAVSPEKGFRTVDVEKKEIEYATIKKDLDNLTYDHDLARSVFLFHAPPYKSAHDRAALDGKMVAHAPLDVHVGSIAIKEFIEKKQPFITLHGHIHESSRITGLWHEMIGRTYTFSAAYDEKDLALVIFDLEEPSRAKRLIL